MSRETRYRIKNDAPVVSIGILKTGLTTNGNGLKTKIVSVNWHNVRNRPLFVYCTRRRTKSIRRNITFSLIQSPGTEIGREFREKLGHRGDRRNIGEVIFFLYGNAK